jgi:hypothetical protein
MIGAANSRGISRRKEPFPEPAKYRHTVTYGTAFLEGRFPRHFVPGYDRAVPPGHFATGSRPRRPAWEMALPYFSPPVRSGP